MRTSLLILASLGFVVPASAQEQPAPGPVRGGAGASFVVAIPQGQFADAIDAGFGLQLNGHYNLTSNGVLRLRADGGFVQYGSETQEVCFSSTVGCRVLLDVVTSNNIIWGGLGPEIALPFDFARPYMNASIGVSYFATASYVSGDNEDESFGETTNLDDAVLAFTGGAGVYFPVRISEKVPFGIDISARYHRNGRVRYLREGDITDHPDGSISFTPRHTDANMVTLQLGVSLGIREKR